MVLTDKRERELLEQVKRADTAYREAMEYIRMVQRREFEERIKQHEVGRAIAVKAAYREGVSKRRIGIEGLGTSSAKTVNDLLNGWP